MTSPIPPTDRTDVALDLGGFGLLVTFVGFLLMASYWSAPIYNDVATVFLFGAFAVVYIANRRRDRILGGLTRSPST
jgi:hypothetical protein